MTASPLRPTDRTRTLALLAVPGVFLAGLLWRSPGLFLAPRIWAEEGHLYLASMQHLSVLKGMALVVNGNYQLLTNAIVEASRLTPTRDIAATTTYLSLLPILTACFMLGQLMLARGLPLLVAAVAAALMALQTSGYEVYLNATNVQWTCSLVALMICLSEEVPAASPRASLRYALLSVCGLTGLPSCILAPLFLAGAQVRKTRFGWALLAVIVLAALVQLWIVVAHRGDLQRPFNLSWMTAVALSLHVAFGAVLPVSLVDGLAASLNGPSFLFEVAIEGGVVLGLVAATAWESLGPGRTLGLLGAAVVSALVNEIGALDRVGAMVGGLGGSRYFFLASCCVAILLAAGLASPVRTKRVMAGAMVGLMLLNGLLEAHAGAWTGSFVSGPSHRPGRCLPTSCALYGEGMALVRQPLRHGGRPPGLALIHRRSPRLTAPPRESTGRSGAARWATPKAWAG